MTPALNLRYDPKGCFMTSSRSIASGLKCGWEPVTTKVNMAMPQAKATLVYLKWSKTRITFDRTNHSNHILQPGWFPLVVSVIVSKTRLTRVLTDGGSGLKLLYTRTYDAMGLSRAAIRSSDAPFYGSCSECKSFR